MNINRYFSLGSESEPEGLTLIVNSYDQNGNFIAGIPNVEGLYKVKEITESEYVNYIKRSKSAENRGYFGVVNATGKEIFDREVQGVKNKLKKKKDKEQALIAKRLARQLEAGLIDKEDLDTAIEIELPGVPADQISVLKNQVNSLRVKHEIM